MPSHDQDTESLSRTVVVPFPSAFAWGAPPRVPGYEVAELIGQGGLGLVYRARHRRSGRLRAIKLARPGAARSFAGEAEHLARVRHPNVVRAFGSGCAGGRPYLVLEFCPDDLHRRLRGERMCAQTAAALVAGAARGAGAVHAAGLVHLDIKPENVLLASDGTPRLADFGSVRPAGKLGTNDGGLIGTPAYLSPEQAAGAREFGPATDVWGLGAVLYACLTGRRLYDGGNLYAVLNAARDATPTPVRALRADVPTELETICEKCLRADPAARYANGSELAAALERLLDGSGNCEARFSRRT